MNAASSLYCIVFAVTQKLKARQKQWKVKQDIAERQLEEADYESHQVGRLCVNCVKSYFRSQRIRHLEFKKFNNFPGGYGLVLSEQRCVNIILSVTLEL